MMKISAAVNDVKAQSFAKTSIGLLMLQFNRDLDTEKL